MRKVLWFLWSRTSRAANRMDQFNDWRDRKQIGVAWSLWAVSRFLDRQVTRLDNRIKSTEERDTH